ncbi:hypothetical protein PAPYR_3747 [Paratrimastix pyriformis]|uniref:Uncharacterized protein n=1 Tax=Paratrimastix pyriformis TaxID=342808 RepID=A0ABQ8ULF8_9EUKA|nr:hypothetical protein PAPYR_3747 [Paratrimastix pyriformis]
MTARVVPCFFASFSVAPGTNSHSLMQYLESYGPAKSKTPDTFTFSSPLDAELCAVLHEDMWIMAHKSLLLLTPVGEPQMAVDRLTDPLADAMRLFEKKAWLEAVRSFTYALAVAPTPVERAAILAKRGATAGNLGCYLRCALDGEEAVRLDPNFEWAYSVAAVGRWRRGEMLKMASLVQRLRARFPHSEHLADLEQKQRRSLQPADAEEKKTPAAPPPDAPSPALPSAALAFLSNNLPTTLFRTRPAPQVPTPAPTNPGDSVPPSATSAPAPAPAPAGSPPDQAMLAFSLALAGLSMEDIMGGPAPPHSDPAPPLLPEEEDDGCGSAARCCCPAAPPQAQPPLPQAPAPEDDPLPE